MPLDYLFLRWKVTVVLAAVLGGSTSLRGETASEPALSNGAVAVPGRESVLEQLKTEYQDELSQFGLQHEPQLIRLENIVLLSTALADFSTRAHYLGRLRIHSEAIFGRDSPQAEDARLALTSSFDFESMSDEQRADLSQAARDYLDIDQLIRTHQAESARKRIESALERRTNVLGPSHPDVGKTLIDAALLIESQETTRFRRRLRRACGNLLSTTNPTISISYANTQRFCIDRPITPGPSKFFVKRKNSFRDATFNRRKCMPTS